MNSCRCSASILLLVLAVLATVSGAAAEGFVFRGGITWDTTPEDMMAAEGVRISDAMFRQHSYNGFTFCYVLGADADVYDDAYYIYRDSLPVMMYTALLKDTKVVLVYNEAVDANTARCGEPIPFTAEELIALFSIIWPENAMVELIEKTAAWRLADGTLAVLFSIEDFNYMAFLNEERLAAAALAPVD